MDYILSIDDTDNLESIGTGEFLQEILELLEQKGLCRYGRITRHQLFFSPLVKYTSHNSSMSAVVHTEQSPEIIFEEACEYLQKNAAIGSDPGICLLRIEDLSEKHIEQLRVYGRKCKKEYVEKEEALLLAKRLDIPIRELGGEGIGVIGALAGAALRLDGNDGRYRGKFTFGANADNMRCTDILSHPYIDAIQTEDGVELSGDTEVFITGQIKTAHLQNRSVLVVKKHQAPEGEIYVNLSKNEMKKY